MQSYLVPGITYQVADTSSMVSASTRARRSIFGMGIGRQEGLVSRLFFVKYNTEYGP